MRTVRLSPARAARPNRRSVLLLLVQLTLAAASARRLPHYGEWERIALEDAFDYVDFIAPHMYFKDDYNDTSEYLAWADQMDGYIKEVVAIVSTAEQIPASGRRKTGPFDEMRCMTVGVG